MNNDLRGLIFSLKSLKTKTNSLFLVVLIILILWHFLFHELLTFIQYVDNVLLLFLILKSFLSTRTLACCGPMPLYMRSKFACMDGYGEMTVFCLNSATTDCTLLSNTIWVCHNINISEQWNFSKLYSKLLSSFIELAGNCREMKPKLRHCFLPQYLVFCVVKIHVHLWWWWFIFCF